MARVVIDNQTAMVDAADDVPDDALHYPVSFVARRWNTDERTVRAMIARGELEAGQLGPRLYRISMKAILASEAAGLKRTAAELARRNATSGA
jgi:excisionase family DNA binding protein